jgi:hypothetical protein
MPKEDPSGLTDKALFSLLSSLACKDVPQREGKRMNKNTGLYSRAESLKHPSAIGELHVSNCHYWIVLLEAEGGESIVSSNAPLQSALCRFEVQGQLCAIVEDGLMPSLDRKDPDPLELLTERELQIARLWPWDA